MMRLSFNMKMIAALSLFGLLLYGFVQGYAIPRQEARDAAYAKRQLNPLTHDLNYILKYKHPYMGSSTTVSNLMGALPLSDFGFTMQLYPDIYTAEIRYAGESSLAGDEVSLQAALLYNATAAFALIDNLEGLMFAFPDALYEATKEQTKHWYQRSDLSTLLEESTWQEKVRKPLADTEYVQRGSAVILRKAER